ncbi:MAG: hypothetical protein EPO32_13450 [Anaerolineae bacterium]|nr:MAG: hypothetical protein EPO32_13450 [Anaerolineae bacterium]
MPKAKRHVPKEDGEAIQPQGQTARQRRRAQQTRSKRQGQMVLVLILGGVFLLVAALVSQGSQPVDTSTLIDPAPRAHPDAADNVIGSPDAKVVLTEYSDFNCSACQSFWLQIETIVIDQYVSTGKIRFEYRSANDFLGPTSADAAEAAYCAGKQDRFWDMHDMIFTNFVLHNTSGYTSGVLTGMAEKLGLDMNAYDDCVDSGEMRDRLDADGEAFRAVNQNLIDAGESYGTPTLAINGERVDIVSSWDELFAALDAAVAAAGQ